MDITWLLVIAYLIGLGLWTKRQNTIYIRALALTTKTQNTYMCLMARKSTTPQVLETAKKEYETAYAALKALEKKS
jgi:multisubunit Na+/H+ antiporter MnhC subunit